MRRWLCPLLAKKEEKKKLREEELWRQCQNEENLKKQVQVHLEQVKKHEHSLEQEKMMLADLQSRLESVSLEVKALRALVAETKEQEGGSPIHAPLALLLGNPLRIMENKCCSHRRILPFHPRPWKPMMMVWRSWEARNLAD